MPIDEVTRRLLDTIVAAGPPLGTQDPATTRAAALERRLAAPATETVELASVENLTIPGPAGTLAIRVYKPPAPLPSPVMFFHGGGWVLCDLDSHDLMCRRLAMASGCLFVSVEYRLAPEHPFPAAVEDAVAATRWVASHRDQLGAAPLGLAVAGDSAGGNLAAVVALLARDAVGPTIDRQALVYPVLNHRFDTPSYTENATHYVLTRAAMQWFWAHYLADPAHGEDPRASPLRTPDLTGAPPALIVTAEFDPLRDEGEAYGTRLRDAGVPTVIHRYDGMFHGFLGHVAVLEQARVAEAEIAAFLAAG